MPEEVKAAIDESLAKLKKEYDIEVVDRIPFHGGQRRLPDKIWRINLPVEISGKAEFLDVYMVFTNSFPFDMPAIILPDDRFRYLPHISSNTQKLCLYEDGIDYDADNIYGLIRDNLDKTKHWISFYTSRDNTDEYAREPASYWAEEYDGEDEVDDFWTLIGNIPEHTCELKGIFYVMKDDKNGKQHFEFIVAPTEESGVLDYISDLHETKEFDALFLSSFEKSVEPPFTLTGRSLVQRLKDEDDKNRLKKYINKHGGGYILFPIGTDNFAGGVHIIQQKCNRSGFRNGIITPYIALTEFDGRVKKIPRLLVSIFSDSRIAERTAGVMMEHRKFIIAGLGSVGSNLCYYLNGYNNAQFTLVDKDKLNLDNIGRHLLGFEHKHQYKVSAVSKYLKEYRPDREVLEVKTLLQEMETVQINNADSIFICTGDIMSERWLLQKMRNGEVNKPVFILWLEPYGISGIMLYVNPEDKESLERLSKSSLIGFENYCLISPDEYKDAEKLIKRDAGCNGKYAIYSGNDVTFFLSAVFPVIDQLMDSPTKSKCYRWVGNIDIAAEKGIGLVSTEYLKHMLQEIEV
ncbi:ThiF family adenylyltransferase [Xylanibacter ruminicola]|uniref:ThiF family protein n=1 Tax=Xylanibacter ruminicola TaxID=839 RepID=A0A1M6R3P0_XYLRU|nr:ThiF family adenylyltransferase [Xylanibacter ruminicola]SHK27115.1 ThiF family protein [Xylanibacter ruminicola]